MILVNGVERYFYEDEKKRSDYFPKCRVEKTSQNTFEVIIEGVDYHITEENDQIKTIEKGLKYVNMNFDDTPVWLIVSLIDLFKLEKLDESKRMVIKSEMRVINK